MAPFRVTKKKTEGSIALASRRSSIRLCHRTEPSGRRTGKEQGIRDVLRLPDTKPARVITVGDDLNDLPRLGSFEDYAMASGRPEVRHILGRETESVAALIDRLPAEEKKGITQK